MRLSTNAVYIYEVNDALRVVVAPTFGAAVQAAAFAEGHQPGLALPLDEEGIAWAEERNFRVVLSGDAAGVLILDDYVA
jgi:hypothetical protein